MWERYDYYIKTNCVSYSGFRLKTRDAYETARNIQYIFKPGFLKMFSTPKPIHIDELCKKYKELCPDMESSFPGHIDMIFDEKLITLLGFPVDSYGLVYWDLSITPEDFRFFIQDNFNHSKSLTEYQPDSNEINKSSTNNSSSSVYKTLEKEYDNWTSNQTKSTTLTSIVLKEEKEKEDAIRERNRGDKEIALKEEKGKGLKSINDLEKNESPSVFKKNLQDTFGTFSDSETKQEKSNSNDSTKEENSNFPSGITSLEKLKELKDKGLISDKNAKDIQKKLLDELIK